MSCFVVRFRNSLSVLFVILYPGLLARKGSMMCWVGWGWKSLAPSRLVEELDTVDGLLLAQIRLLAQARSGVTS
ncbi:hypothetical protein GUJ93_ZPchr0002g23457 [Zizania palustris]|uniref:Uncharacterized protein n=1 Tax=Zizania palustris TaxID=103762 RepID=A0A8J5VBE6_ZIZPA|nr:hypothetical protein GUJ93_ZPchr0002g23457 [Zizania palustris]